MSLILCPNCRYNMLRTMNDQLDDRLSYVDVEWKCSQCNMVVTQRYTLTFECAIREGINEHGNLQDGKL